jgi:CRISPR/Cas system CMR-associated protein Cmr5 small subunit
MSSRYTTRRGNQPDSPETKQLKVLQNRTIQQKAFQELMDIREEKGGLIGYGDYKSIMDKYRSKGFDCVTRRNLRYRLSLAESQNSKGLMITEDFFASKNGYIRNEDDISPITEDLNNNQTVVSKQVSRKKDKKDHLQHINDCVTKVANVVLEAIQNKDNNGYQRLPPKMLQQIIDRVETENSLVPGTIKPARIRSRI